MTRSNIGRFLFLIDCIPRCNQNACHCEDRLARWNEAVVITVSPSQRKRWDANGFPKTTLHLAQVSVLGFIIGEIVFKRPQLRSLKPRLTPEDLIPVVRKEFGCGRETILQKGKKRNLARDVAIYLSREITGESGVALGGYFGGISGAGVVVRYNHIANKIETDRRLKGQVNRIRKKTINI